MAVNINATINQANQLNDEISKLRIAKSKMMSYRNSVSENWQGTEASYILSAIDDVTKRIDDVIRKIESLSKDIKTVASQIKREQDAAAARASLNRKINAYQNAYDKAEDELSDLEAKRDDLIKRRRPSSLLEKFKIENEIKEINEEIAEAEKKRDRAYANLKAVKK